MEGEEQTTITPALGTAHPKYSTWGTKKGTNVLPETDTSTKNIYSLGVLEKQPLHCQAMKCA